METDESDDGLRQWVESLGDIRDLGRPWFLVPKDSPAPTSEELAAKWPVGWVEIGATVDPPGKLFYREISTARTVDLDTGLPVHPVEVDPGR
jgi:hypothetical protein